MKTLSKLYPYLTESELLEGKEIVVNRLLKIGKFSDKKKASCFILNTMEKKIQGVERNSLERQIVTFFNQYKREKSPMHQALKNARSIHASMPSNSKITFKS